MKFILILLGLALVLFAGFTVTANSRSMRTVLGVSTSAYRSATITWKSVAGASGYNIYYKQQSDKNYTHSVINLPASSTSYTINYLRKNQSYQYIITAFDSSGSEFWSSKQMWIWDYKLLRAESPEFPNGKFNEAHENSSVNWKTRAFGRSFNQFAFISGLRAQSFLRADYK